MIKTGTENICKEFFVVASHFSEEDKVFSIQQAVEFVKNQRLKLLTDARHKCDKQMKKSMKFREKLADARGRLDLPSTEQVLLTGLLEAERIAEERLLDTD